ncbi:MAG: hypothetical protein HC906_00050 [Bacteroidales bacterium]|nr:hypothetical protein [Bacteroidales bacterium]
MEKELIEKKTLFEQEFKAREQNLISAETELKELREKNASFPKILEESVKKAEDELSARLKSTFNFENQLKTKEYEGEIKITRPGNI